MLLYMLEQGYDNGHLENVSLYSLYQMFIEFGTKDEMRGQEKINALDELFQSLPIGNPAKSAYATSNFASGEMRSSIFSTLASNLTLFGSDVGVSKLTSGNQIDFKSLSSPDKPMALFMLVPDNDTSRYVLASLFVNQCYDELVELSSTFTGQKLKQRVHFILDEFGNMVHIPSMDTKITVGAGRNLLFNLFVQDLNQLDSVYGNEAKTIRSNCGNLIYINSLDGDTNEYFSRVLGNKTIEYNTYSGNLNDWLLSNQSGVVDSQPLLTAEQLSNLPKGSAVTKRQRCHPMQTQFDFFYKLGIKPQSLSEIAKKMTLINRDLSETIYPLEEMWTNIITRRSGGEGGISDQAYNWKEAAENLLKSKENNLPKWVWQVDTERSNDSETYYKLIPRVKTTKAIRTNFAPKIEIVSEVDNILKAIESRNPTDYRFISDTIDQLTDMSNEDKQKAVKKVSSVIKRQIGLSASDKEKLEQYIGTFYNG
jgi:type IV secretion system protein VirD4